MNASAEVYSLRGVPVFMLPVLPFLFLPLRSLGLFPRRDEVRPLPRVPLPPFLFPAVLRDSLRLSLRVFGFRGDFSRLVPFREPPELATALLLPLPSVVGLARFVLRFFSNTPLDPMVL